MTRNDDYTTANLLDFSYHQKCKLIGIDLSRPTSTSISQQINFTGKLKDDGLTMFFIAKNQQKTIHFSLNSLIASE